MNSDFQDFIEGVFLIVLGGAIMWGFSAAIKSEQPNNFDTMLCSVHVPVGTMLVTDRIIECTNGKRYVEVE